MANDGNIKVNIDVITNMTNAVKGLQDLAEKAKTHAKDINRTLESALKMPNMFGKGGGVFGNMLQSMKEMQRGISTVSTTMRESMGEVSTAMNEVKKAVDTASSSIVNLSTHINNLTSKKIKVEVEQVFTGNASTSSGGTSSGAGTSSSSVGGPTGNTKIPANFLDVKNKITAQVYDMVNPTRDAISKLAKQTITQSGLVGSAADMEQVEKFIDNLTKAAAGSRKFGAKDLKSVMQRWAEDNRATIQSVDDIKKQLVSMLQGGRFTVTDKNISPANIQKMAESIARSQMVTLPDSGVNKFKETAASKELTNILRTRLKDTKLSTSPETVTPQQAVAAENILMSLRGAKGSKGQFKVSLSELEKLGIDLANVDKISQIKQLGSTGKTPQQIKEEVVLRFTRSMNAQLDAVSRKIISDFEKQQEIGRAHV